MSDTYTYPSMRRRMFGFAIANSMQYTGFVAIFGTLATLTMQSPSFASVSQSIFLAATAVGLTYFLYKIGKQGMTFRHFLFGYKVVNSEDGSYPTIFKLYTREVVAYAAGCVWLMKMLLPMFFKVTMQAMDGKNDHHVVVASNNNLYVSNQSIGQMRASQAFDESKANTENEMYRLSQKGFFHDNLFGTCAVNTSRVEVLKTFKKLETNPALPAETNKAA